jgi:hypothetical protein
MRGGLQDLPRVSVPLAELIGKTRDGRPRRISDFLSRREYRALPLSRELYGQAASPRLGTGSLGAETPRAGRWLRSAGWRAV